MNDWLGTPTASRKHSQAGMIEEAHVTGTQEDRGQMESGGEGKMSQGMSAVTSL